MIAKPKAPRVGVKAPEFSHRTPRMAGFRCINWRRDMRNSFSRLRIVTDIIQTEPPAWLLR